MSGTNTDEAKRERKGRGREGRGSEGRGGID